MTNTPVPPTPVPPTPGSTTKGSSESRWALIREINDHPRDQNGLWLMLALWLAAVVLGMFAIGGGNPISFQSLFLLGADLVALLLMLGLWSTLNPGVILAVHAPLACISAATGSLSVIGVVSVAIMFGAAEAGQNWWSVVADHQEDGATIIEPPDRRMASLEVAAIAIGAAILVGILSVFESRLATVAAIGVFLVLVVGGVLLRSRD